MNLLDELRAKEWNRLLNEKYELNKFTNMTKMIYMFFSWIWNPNFGS